MPAPKGSKRRTRGTRASTPSNTENPPDILAVRNKNNKTSAKPKVGIMKDGNTSSEPTARGSKSGRSPRQLGSAPSGVFSLPTEIMDMIFDHIDSPATLARLCQTSKSWYALMMPRLHQRIYAGVNHYGGIKKFIMTVEQYLTIAQKKKIKAIREYKGQQEDYPTHVDEECKPFCANYVRQFIVDGANPGKKHTHSMEAYIEAALCNMDNLELVNTSVLTKSMAEHLASQKNLRALRLLAADIESGVPEPLSKLKNLKHLSWEKTFGPPNRRRRQIDYGEAIGYVILNSASTLQSLVLQDWGSSSRFFHNHEDLRFTALKLLSLTGLDMDPETLPKALDFTKLRELRLNHLCGDRVLFFHKLAESISRSSTIKLARLSIFMGFAKPRWNRNFEQDKADFEAACQFIASFDTLKTLEVEEVRDCNLHFTDPDAVPRLPEVLVQAILKHQNLRTLKINYGGLLTGDRIPFLSAANVTAFARNLPLLQYFEFEPDDKELAEVGEGLAHSASLVSCKCQITAKWTTRRGYGAEILMAILKGFLSHNTHLDRGSFIWEDHYSLKRMATSGYVWEVASSLENATTGIPKALEKEQAKTFKHGQREVMYRDIIKQWAAEYRLENSRFPFRWVDKIAEFDD